MDETPNIGLPLVQASQAQKHVTVNEALLRADAAAQLVLLETERNAPPTAPQDGACYGIGAAPSGDWSGEAGRVALADNGGWTFLDPKPGWRGWSVEAACPVVWHASSWRRDGGAMGATGAGTHLVTEEVVHTVSPGASNTTGAIVPANVTLLAVSARVVTALTGSVGTWQLGESGAAGRFGTGLGASAGSYALGVVGQPQAYYAPTPVEIEAETGAFDTGEIRLALHYMRFVVPEV